RIRVGLVGLGRLGRVYARDLATRIPETRLVAVADTDEKALAEVSATYDARPHADPGQLFQDSEVEAIVIASPTHTHADLTVAAAASGKPTFCEKPPALSLAETERMKAAVARPGVFFQMGFMRRFDPGYAAAKRKVQEGLIGTPVVFKSSSRDPHRTTLEYANPKSSGGMIMDMGIHDFDLARFFMGEVKTVTAVGGTLAYPELKTVGDIDNAIVSLVFGDERIGVVDLSRNGIYGYDISTELLGTEGTLRIGYIRETPLLVMTKNSVAHDTVPYFMERFAQAYTIQLQDFARNVIEGRPPTLTIDDGIAAIKIALAAERARQSGRPVSLAEVTA
ncbi:MAG TPA: Gfo/Idh/MocA family oxidoreductase, partial [Vicinamibacteria bacterium]|nr:Gfo/Idh/MocA family oxidoreductase [Vicinamibacteria bacterium]